MKKPARVTRSRSRTVGSTPSRPDARSDVQRRHDAEVFQIEQTILGAVERKHRDMLDAAEQLIAEKLAPVDAHAARILLDEIRRGELP
jgi:hypothetical protein